MYSSTTIYAVSTPRSRSWVATGLLRIGAVREGASRFSRSDSGTDRLRRCSGMVVADDVFERRLVRERVRRQTSGHYRGFDATGVQPRRRPVARDGQVVELQVQWGQTILNAARKRQDVSVARVHVGRPVLGVEPRR